LVQLADIVPLGNQELALCLHISLGLLDASGGQEVVHAQARFTHGAAIERVIRWRFRRDLRGEHLRKILLEHPFL